MTYCKDNDSILERILRIVIISVVVLSMMIPVMAPEVFAASSVTISGGDSVKGGDTFTVAVTFGGGSVGRVDGQLTYDTDKLTYISGGSSSGNSGYIQLKKAGTDGSVVFNLEFQAVSDGSTTLEVTTNEIYDLDEVYLGETPSASKTVSISGKAASEELITQTTSPDEPVAETELIGVDEKPEDEAGGALGMNLILIIIAVVLVVLIVIIAIVLKKKKAPKGVKAPASYEEADDESISPGREYGAPLHEDERAEERARRQAVKKRASEETELWNDWKGMDDEDKL